MGIRIWKIEFGWNTEKIHIEAKNINEAIKKAKKIRKAEIKSMPDDYWISSVSIDVETDE